ncbi:sensor histidine kinase [Corynebacterium flavescens]|uniref:sensor histidine kinase n=1 Tax=Corynebacterium flavescens TaxID=28028 RepID=UPI003FD65299
MAPTDSLFIKLRDGFRFNATTILLLSTAVALYAVAWPTSFQTHTLVSHNIHLAIIPLLAATGTWPVLTALRWPGRSWAFVALSCLVCVPFRDNPDFALGWPVAFHLALAFTLGVAIVKASDKVAVAAVLGSTALMAFNPAEVRAGWVVGVIVWSIFFLLLRWLLASRASLRLESSRASEESQLRVMAEERNRLSRDLHDVVAHQMSMIVVQAQSAPYRLQGVTPAIHAEFDSLSSTARAALNQVRELLGVLRSDAEEGAMTPVGADQIEPTLAAARRAGMDISWVIDADVAHINETAGVVVQRVLQECLSNASRHAPGAKVLVALHGTQHEGKNWAQLKVDNGPAAAGSLRPPEHGGGSGIEGMSARVRTVGGAFSALPAADGGFSVAAEIPLNAR